MTEFQLKVFNAIKENDFAADYSKDRVITIQYLRDVLPDLKNNEAYNAISSLEGVKIIDSTKGMVSIPCKYFNEV